MHIRISYIYPSPPRANEAHDLIVEWVGLNPGNLTGNVSRSVFGETPTFAISTRHENMDAFEKSRDAMTASSEIHEFTSKLSPSLRQPTNVTIANALTIGESLATLTERDSIPARVTLDESMLCSASSRRRSRRRAERLTVCSNSITTPQVSYSLAGTPINRLMSMKMWSGYGELFEILMPYGG